MANPVRLPGDTRREEIRLALIQIAAVAAWAVVGGVIGYFIRGWM